MFKILSACVFVCVHSYVFMSACVCVCLYRYSFNLTARAGGTRGPEVPGLHFLRIAGSFLHFRMNLLFVLVLFLFSSGDHC